MGLNLETLRTLEEARKATTPVNRAPLEVKANRIPVAEANLNLKIKEISTMLSVEKKEGEETRKPQPQTTGRNGFEPFINGNENGKNNLFVNLYGGNFSQKMELNRKGVERVLEIAHLDGTVILTSLIAPRKSSEAQGNELAAKRNLFFGDKIQDEDRENPSHRVISVPEGWRIEINDQKLTEELTEKKLSGKKLQRAFIKRFNGHFREALKECVRREKLSNEKDKYFRSKLLWSLTNPTAAFIAVVLNKFDPAAVAFNIGTTLFVFSLFNTTDMLISHPIRRKVDHLYEYLLPRVEIDKVMRSFAYLSTIGQGRTLVKEKKPEIK